MSGRARGATLLGGALLGAAVALAPAACPAWVQGSAVNDDGQRVLFHQTGNCVTWSLGEEGSDDVADPALLREAAARAFAEWNRVDCTYVRFVEGPSAACGCDELGYDDGGRNANLLAWCEDEWPADFPAGAIAITVVSYDTRTGEILDTDVAMNGVSFTFTATDGEVHADVQNTLAHEAGHMLGFAESNEPQATMWGFSHDGDVEKRSLFQDDVDGVCAVYPVASDPGRCASPVGGIDTCRKESKGCGCAVARDGAAPGALVASILAALAFFGLRLARLRRGARRADPITR